MPAGGLSGPPGRVCARAGILCLEHGTSGAALWAGAEVRRRCWGDGRAARMEVTAYLR